MKLTPEQKIQIMREMDSKLAVSFTLAIKFFEEVLEKRVESKKAEAKDLFKEIDDSINKLSDKKKKEFERSIDSIMAYVDNVRNSFDRDISRLKGKDGKDGADGKDAKVDYALIFDYINSRYTQPKDGSPDKPQDIVNKLNTTKASVEPSVIKGYKDNEEQMLDLAKEIASIKKAVRENRRGGGSSGGGGGMGNWIHQTTSISSATTTVSLSYEPAANGNAILVRYQGQLLAHGVQYSIGGKIITLNFTPIDSTFLEVTYVRS